MRIWDLKTKTEVSMYFTDSDVLVVPHLEVIIHLFFRCNLDTSLLTFCSVHLGPKQPRDNSGYPAKGVDGGLHGQANLCDLFRHPKHSSSD